MLQQTQVKTVLERYYTPFLTKFPTIAALASAHREEVLKAWAGLGYYRRAGNLHEAAKMVVTPPNGGVRIPRQARDNNLPKTIETLTSLPGIGKNTAHAIVSFSYGTPVPVMEANVKRVLCRLFAIAVPKEEQLWKLAHALLPPQAGEVKKSDIFVHNQAMMDIGAMICTPKAPRCSECPVSAWCKGKTAPELYPTKVKAKAVPIKQRHILIIEHDGLVYAEPREGAHLGGLYRFLETNSERIKINGANFDLRTLPYQPLTHHYSHYTLEAKVYRLHLPKAFKRYSSTWWSADEIKKLPMSNLEKKALTALAAWTPKGE